MVEVTIDPTTRIEGHHGTTLEVEDGQVVEAKSQMKMFRGAEIVTVGRTPRDAAQLTGMVCGVCFLCHRLCSSKASEDAAMDAGVYDGPPRNAVLLRDAAEGIFYLWNHAIHLFALAGPDYSDAVADTDFDRIDPLEGDGYQAALANQRKLMKALTEFGGRAPHPVGYIPGGLATKPDASTIQQVKSRVREVSNWLGPDRRRSPKSSRTSRTANSIPTSGRDSTTSFPSWWRPPRRVPPGSARDRTATTATGSS